MKGRQIRSAVALFLATFFIIINFLAPITVIAASPWSGNSWEGQSWQGNSWQGTPWEGHSWTGTPWQGESWSGSQWSSESWQGNQWNGNRFSSESWQGNQWNNPNWQGSPWMNQPSLGQSWDGNTFNGNGWDNSFWQGNPWNGNYAQGNPWNQNSGNGTPWQGIAGTGSAFTANEFTPPFADAGYFELSAPNNLYDWQKFLGKDILTGVISVVDSDNYTHGQIGRSILYSSMKLVTGQNNDAVKGTFDVISTGKNLAEGTRRANELMNYLKPELLQRGAVFSRSAAEATTQVGTAFKAVSRLGAAGAAIGTVFSAVDTINNFREGKTLETIGSFGDTLMGAGTVALAIPGGQAIGAGLVATGALLSAGAGAVKLWRNRKKIINDGKKIINSAVKTYDTVRKGVGTMFNKVTSFFGG
ncbi:hypothetical protein [Halalkalibacter urbisdiaboli]|uniref:hypothetical protein n=1 Tax=Halalkalibacter urbisdiaboli TaxID=1960589 RepID=UPI000B43C2DB|nr:hypothetical protein [Halalkalibacter urbisdiaboli]